MGRSGVSPILAIIALTAPSFGRVPLPSMANGADDIEVTAHSLSAQEKEEVWPRLHQIVPQFRTYLGRTDR